MTKQNPVQGMRRIMVGLVAIALCIFVVAATQFLRLPQGSPAVIHLVMALGIMPLIMGAMIYFTPVLTRSRAPEGFVLFAPVIALIAGMLVTASLVWRRELLPIAALTGLLSCTVLLGWMWYRARHTLGTPHPGLYWYLFALLSLLLGLVAILGAIFWPEHWLALRRFHLHINVLGFIGLTALGTLRVLVPTVAGYADPGAGQWLKRNLPLAVTGAWLVAVCAAVAPRFSLVGLLLWLIPWMRFAVAVVVTRRTQVWGWNHAGTSLAVATLGWGAVLATGGLHAAVIWPAHVTTQLLFLIFLLPLVTGAVSYLLPVWIWPARSSSAYAVASQRLAYGSGMRALVFLTAGVLVASGFTGAIYLALAGIAVFVLQVVWSLRA
ncbi:MAG: hypothetical protein AAB134_05365 [Pseudomonadota bacterium]